MPILRVAMSYGTGYALSTRFPPCGLLSLDIDHCKEMTRSAIYVDLPGGEKNTCAGIHSIAVRDCKCIIISNCTHVLEVLLVKCSMARKREEL